MAFKVIKNFFRFIFFYFLYVPNVVVSSDIGAARYNFWDDSDQSVIKRSLYENNDISKAVVKTIVVGSSVKKLEQKTISTSNLQSNKEINICSEREKIYYEME